MFGLAKLANDFTKWDKYIDPERKDYFGNQRVHRNEISMDVKYRKLNKADIDSLVQDPRIQAGFIGKEYRNKAPKSEWNKDYLDKVSCASIAQSFNQDYLYHMNEVADHLAHQKAIQQGLIRGGVGLGLAGVGTGIALGIKHHHDKELSKQAAHEIKDKGEAIKGAKKAGADEKEMPKDAVYPDEFGIDYPDRTLFHGLNVMASNRGIEGKLKMVAHNKPQICLSTHHLGTIGVAGKTHIYGAFTRDVGSDFDKDGRRYITKASKEFLIENPKFIHAREVIGILENIQYVWVSKKSSAFKEDYTKAKELAKSINVPVKIVGD